MNLRTAGRVLPHERLGIGRPGTEESTLSEPQPAVGNAPAAPEQTPASSRAGALATLPDAELLRRIQADNLDAFEALFARYRGLIHRTAYGLTGDPQTAEEILQDTFVRAYRHRQTLRTDMSPVPWLHRVALNLCYSRLGRRRLPVEPIGEATHELRDTTPEPAEHVEREELRRTIRFGVAALPPKHQSVVVLYYLHGMSLQETAETLGIALGTVKSRLHYALHALRTHLAAERRHAELDVAGVVPAPATPAPQAEVARVARGALGRWSRR